MVRPFRFQAAWLAHDDFARVLEESWSRSTVIPVSLARLTEALKIWNKQVFGNIFRRKRTLTLKLRKLEVENEGNSSARSRALEESVRRDLEKTLWEEQLLWLQKSRACWINEGDRNIRFFHLSTLKRRRFNKIVALKNEDGVWVTDEFTLQSLARGFYVELYQVEAGAAASLPALFEKLDAVAGRDLDRGLTSIEVRQAVMDMGSLKAPGKDGYQPVLFQRCWSTIGEAFSQFVEGCFLDPVQIRLINETLLVLIPKRESPESIKQFRPIGLCNVVYKVLAKCLVNRIKPYMRRLVHPMQTSFVPGRHITDNIIIVQESL
ncbi:unnamed protein product [Linum trigynum]|uniref:Reverse transcriptase n=1 Tax=Linum trigynum TaxID=586398 RepID=A0AAV2CM54_9ROSI